MNNYINNQQQQQHNRLPGADQRRLNDRMIHNLTKIRQDSTMSNKTTNAENANANNAVRLQYDITQREAVV